MSERKHLDPNQGVLVIVAYRPKPGQEAALLELAKQHVPILRGQGLVTERPVQVMRAADGTIIEVFEWKSPAAIDVAHTNQAVLKMWERYAGVCDYVPLVQVRECSDLFAGFAPVDLQ